VDFISPTVLFGLLAVAAPIVIHLLNKRRYRTVKWAAMSFILKATRESRGKKRLKHIIILTMRALAIAALVFAIARPLWNKLGGGGAEVDTVIIILDRSSSMELDPNAGRESKRVKVMKNIQASLQQMDNANILLLDSATQKITDITTVDALLDIPETQRSDTSANIPELINKAVTFISTADTGTTEIWLASDLQKSDWNTESNRWKSIPSLINDITSPIKLRVIASKSEESNNKSISITNQRREGDDIIIEITIKRQYEAPKEVIPLQFVINDIGSSSNITIESEKTVIQKRFPLPKDSEIGHGHVQLQADDNLSDNIAYYSFSKNAPSLTLLFTEGGETQDAFMRVATSMSHFTCQQFSFTNFAQAPISDATLIIWQGALPTGNTATQLEKFIEQGGSVLFLPSKEVNANKFLGLQWKTIINASNGKFIEVADWDEINGPFRNTSSGQIIPLDSMLAIRTMELSGEFISLASWNDGTPLLARKVVGEGTALFLSTLPDLNWSQMEHSAIHIILFHRLITEMSKRFSKSGSQSISNTLVDRLIDQNARSIKQQSSESKDALYLAGVWEVGDKVIATNRPSSEDSQEIINQSIIAGLLEGVNFSYFEESNKEKKEPFMFEIWKYVLLTMFIFLITEAFLCLQPKRQSLKQDARQSNPYSAS